MAEAAPEAEQPPVKVEGAAEPQDGSSVPEDASGREAAAEGAEPNAGSSTGSLEAAERKKELGNAAFKAKKHREAVRLYGEAIAEAGAAAPGVYFSNRAVCQAALGDWAAAREDAAEALRRPGGITKKAIFQKARAEVRLQRLADAQETLAFAAEHGLRQDVLKLLSDEGLPAGLTQPEPAPRAAAPVAEAAPAVKPASEQAPQTPSQAPSPSQAAPPAAPAPAAKPAGELDAAAKAKEAGTAKYKEGAYREALAEYRRALDLLPQDDSERRAPLLGNVAAACLMLRRAGECCEACEESLALDPANCKVRARLATAKVASGDFVGARAALGEANGDATLANARRQVDEYEELFSVADNTLGKGEPAKALGLFSDLETKALFNCPALALKMGRCYLELKNYPRALNATQQVLRANPRNIDALVLRTEALYRNNTASVDSKQWTEPLDQGQKLLKEALSFDPDHSAAAVLRKRLRLLCTKHGEMREAFDGREFEKAQEVLDAMIEQGQDNPMMLGNLYVERARAGVRLKDWRQVLKDVGQATYRNHELVQPYLFRALALQALDRHEDAVKELEQLLSWHREQSVYEKLQDAKFLLRKKKRANYYELLGVPSIASALEIKKAYRERAAEWHPDKKGHLDEEAKKNAEEMFKRIGEAYEVLTDPQKKELYDKGYDREGIDEQMELKKRRTEGCGFGGCRPGGGC